MCILETTLNFPILILVACNCDVGGTANGAICDKTTGVCHCRPHVTGTSCNRYCDHKWLSLLTSLIIPLEWLQHRRSVHLSWGFLIINNYSPQWRWLVMHIYQAAKRWVNIHCYPTTPRWIGLLVYIVKQVVNPFISSTIANIFGRKSCAKDIRIVWIANQSAPTTLSSVLVYAYTGYSLSSLGKL